MEDFTREFIASLIGKPLGEIVQMGAQKIVEETVLAEFEAFMRQYSALLDDRGRQVVVRNSSHRERAIMTAAGELNVKVPRVRDRREEDVEKAQFRSSIFPLYLRRVDRICTLSQNEKERMTRLNYAVAIDRLLPDRGLWEEKRAKGLLRAKYFSWQESADKLLQVCREVVK